ncbi:MAG: cation-translocating P-type ATPase [Verrucomicrobiae bacterium]|nr:cation-translocating P-type ATPase [Verrucomicrobiae bacterium]
MDPSASVASSTLELSISGMTCQGCVRHATDALATVPGVDSVEVRLDPGRATIRAKGRTPALEALLEAVRSVGFEALPIGADETPKQERFGWRFPMFLGITVTALLMLGEWGFGFGGQSWFRYSSFFLAALVQSICGARFYAGAWRQLKRGSSNMDTLVAIGSTTAFAFSAWALFTDWPGHLYFMEAAAIISLVSLGHHIESRVAARAEGSLRDLLHLVPETAERRKAEGLERVPVSLLKVGDEVLLKPGDRIPVDGIVTDGAGATDESMLTGESLPVEKQVGSSLYGGTTNHDGRLVMRVTATGDGTALAGIIDVVRRAQNSRASIQRLGDRVSNVFVPVVLLIAIGTALWWGLAYENALRVATTLLPFVPASHYPAAPLEAAVIHLAGVLIIACPCAMGLATPAAIMAGVNAAARRGILIRDGVALEKSGRITTVIFDKTGTLTAGRLTVEEFKSADPSAPAIASALATGSNHPLSVAVREHLRFSPVIQIERWRELPGKGVEATVENKTVRLGSLDWLQNSGTIVSTEQNQAVQDAQRDGCTVIGLSRNSDLLGLIQLRDALKPAAKEVVKKLRLANLRPLIVSGDHIATARSIGLAAGFADEEIHAGIQPADKAALIRRLQGEGHRVAFIGDGINDAPALEQADLGIAVSRASDIARKSADILLLRSDIQAIPTALDLARATLRTIHQNLFWAFFYNVAAIPLAVLGIVSPVICAAAMGFSDLIVVGNALRLLRRPDAA